MVANISCPFSSFTLNIALDKASTMVPSCLMSACLAIQFWERKDRHKSLNCEKLRRNLSFGGQVGKYGRKGAKAALLPGQFYLGHGIIMILEFMDTYRMVHVPPVLPIPHLKRGKIAFFR